MIKKKYFLMIIIILSGLQISAQVNRQEPVTKREVTLYNPYIPSLPEFRKRSFLPEMKDTTRIRPEFRYEIRTEPFMPEYIISPIKAAALLPDPLPKLYKSYLNIGLGNYITPLAELSITNERSKKGAIGFYGRHFSSNGKVQLQNDKKVFAGYMDNDASLFGKKFFKKNVFESSVDYAQKVRYAYGYDTSLIDYDPVKKDIRQTYQNIGAKGSLYSSTLDSSGLSYRFDVVYNYFHYNKSLFQHNAGINGMVATSFKGFYAGSGLSYDFYKIPEDLLTTPKYIFSLTPFVRKTTYQWSFNLGLKALIEKNMSESSVFHIYPDIDFGFNIVPSYISFFAGLSGKLEKNDPLKIISENPFLYPDGSLFTLHNTDHELIVFTGLKGNNGIGGNYELSASYSLISDMLFYSNLVFPDIVYNMGSGNMFASLTDDVELLNIHGELTGTISDKFSYSGVANMYKYTLSTQAYAWNKPSWDAKFGLIYNLRDKIIAGMEITTVGMHREIVNGDYSSSVLPLNSPVIFKIPTHVNINLTAEYRYSKILSFWARFNNISFNRYYEWAYYPSQRFLGMIGFTYSL